MCLIFRVLIVPMELHVTLPEKGYVSELGESGVISNTAINYGKTKQEGDCVTFYSIPLGSKSNKLTEKIYYYFIFCIISSRVVPLHGTLRSINKKNIFIILVKIVKKKIFSKIDFYLPITHLYDITNLLLYEVGK